MIKQVSDHLEIALDALSRHAARSDLALPQSDKLRKALELAHLLQQYVGSIENHLVLNVEGDAEPVSLVSATQPAQPASDPAERAGAARTLRMDRAAARRGELLARSSAATKSRHDAAGQTAPSAPEKRQARASVESREPAGRAKRAERGEAEPRDNDLMAAGAASEAARLPEFVERASQRVAKGGKVAQLSKTRVSDSRLSDAAAARQEQLARPAVRRASEVAMPPARASEILTAQNAETPTQMPQRPNSQKMPELLARAAIRAALRGDRISSSGRSSAMESMSLSGPANVDQSQLLGAMSRAAIKTISTGDFKPEMFELAEMLAGGLNRFGRHLRAYHSSRSGQNRGAMSFLTRGGEGFGEFLSLVEEQGIVSVDRILLRRESSWATLKPDWRFKTNERQELLVDYRVEDPSKNQFLYHDWMTAFVYNVVREYLQQVNMRHELFAKLAFSAPLDLIRLAGNLDAISLVGGTAVAFECISGKVEPSAASETIGKAKELGQVLQRFMPEVMQFRFVAVFDGTCNEEGSVRSAFAGGGVEPRPVEGVRQLIGETFGRAGGGGAASIASAPAAAQRPRGISLLYGSGDQSEDSGRHSQAVA